MVDLKLLSALRNKIYEVNQEEKNLKMFNTLLAKRHGKTRMCHEFDIQGPGIGLTF